MMKEWTPLRYQQSAIKFLHNRTLLSGNSSGGGALFLDPGMGKTAIVLEWIRQMREFGFPSRTLIVAPKTVCRHVWPTEVATWSNFRHMTHAVAVGDVFDRRKALATQANIHIINRDAMGWLAKSVAGRERLPWDLLVVDESGSFRTWSAQRSIAIRKLAQSIPFRVVMNGTPTPNNKVDLFPQLWLLNGEQCPLGKDVTAFRRRFCAAEGDRDHNRWTIHPAYEGRFDQEVAPMCLRLDIQDYLSMPQKVEKLVHVDLPPNARAAYEDMEKRMFVTLQSGDPREARNAAAKYMCCRQIASGHIYDEQKQAHQVHSEMVDAVVGLHEELNRKPLLVAFHFTHELQSLRRAFPGMRWVAGGVSARETADIVERWNSDTLRPNVLAVHPMSMAHGVNMQKGSCRDIVWFGPTDSSEYYQQFNARVWRMGVGSTVRIHKLCAKGTVHELIWQRISDKVEMQDDLLLHLRDYARLKGYAPAAR